MNIDNDAIEHADDAEPNGKRRKILIVIASVFGGIGFAWFVYWFFVLSVRERTDDAYVAGNQVSVSAQVPGTVIAVFAENTALVEAGQVLVRLDPTDSETALSRAANSLIQAVRQVRQQRAMAAQYDALIATRKLELTRAEEDVAKREPLLEQQAVAPEELRHAREAVAMAHAALDQAQQQSHSAHVLLDGFAVRNNPIVLLAKDAYRDAWIAAKRNEIVSPIKGYVAQRSVQLGQRVAPGQPLLTVIALNDLWIEANFKESQIGQLRIGQPTEVRSDLYGSDPIFHGKVIGMAAGTGAAFSLLPAQNASGNWIKVVQRVPVRIAFDPAELAKHPLRIGLSVTATVDTHKRDGTVLAALPAVGNGQTTAVYSVDIAQAAAEADAIIAKNSGEVR